MSQETKAGLFGSAYDPLESPPRDLEIKNTVLTSQEGKFSKNCFVFKCAGGIFCMNLLQAARVGSISDCSEWKLESKGCLSEGSVPIQSY